MARTAPELPLPGFEPETGLPPQVGWFPKTRFMGSKYRLLPFIHSALRELDFQSALDAFSGSGTVAYLLKAMGKRVVANDHLHFCYHNAQAAIANERWRLRATDLEALVCHNRTAKRFIQITFQGLYYSDEDNRFLDNLIANIAALPNRYLRSTALAAACRACVKVARA